MVEVKFEDRVFEVSVKLADNSLHAQRSFDGASVSWALKSFMDDYGVWDLSSLFIKDLPHFVVQEEMKFKLNKQGSAVFSIKRLR